MKKLQILLIILLITNIIFSQTAEPTTANVIQLPTPTGEFAVGTTVYHWIDANRIDSISENPNERRQVMVQIWYPANPQPNAPKAPYISLLEAFRLQSKDETFGTRYGSVRTNSFAGAPFNPKISSAPMVLIVPGRGVSRDSYTSTAEDLASHGYVVAAIDIPYSGSVALPDGRIIAPLARWRISREVLTGPYEEVDKFFAEAANLGTADIRFVLNQLEKLDANDAAGRFTKKLNLKQIGIFGHSLGARIATAACGSDKRLKACLGIEGTQPRELRQNGMTQPLALILGGGQPEQAMKTYKEIIPNLKNTMYLIEVNGAGHNSFTDLPLIETKQFSYKINTLRAMEITRNLIRGFFDKHLQNKNLEMLVESNKKFEEVKIEEFSPQKR
jgi:dienelactone hydrolase